MQGGVRVHSAYTKYIILIFTAVAFLSLLHECTTRHTLSGIIKKQNKTKKPDKFIDGEGRGGEGKKKFFCINLHTK